MDGSAPGRPPDRTRLGRRAAEVLAVREWVRFMLEEIRRKEAEAEEAQAERRRRAAGRGGIPQEPPDREQPGDDEAPAGADD